MGRPRTDRFVCIGFVARSPEALLDMGIIPINSPTAPRVVGGGRSSEADVGALRVLSLIVGVESEGHIRATS